MLPTNMLESLVILDIFVSNVYMEDKSCMKCQLQCLHLEKYFIQQNMI